MESFEEALLSAEANLDPRFFYRIGGGVGTLIVYLRRSRSTFAALEAFWRLGGVAEWDIVWWTSYRIARTRSSGPVGPGWYDRWERKRACRAKEAMRELLEDRWQHHDCTKTVKEVRDRGHAY